MSIKLEGVSQRVPYPVAFLQMLKSRALLGDLRAMRMIVELMREVGLLAAMISEEQRQILARHSNAKDGRPDHLSHEEALALLSDDDVMVSEIESARAIAFMLAKAAREQDKQEKDETKEE